MEITVTMNDDDFAEFMEWRRERLVYEHEVQKVGKQLEELASKVLAAMEECGTGKEPVYKITNQWTAVELVESAVDALE